MSDPVKISLGSDDLAPLFSAMAWLVGYVEGTGRTVPPVVEHQKAQLAEWLSRTANDPHQVRHGG